MSKREYPVSVRLPSELHERIKGLAERQHRSVHGEIIHLLEQAADDAERAERLRRT